MSFDPAAHAYNNPALPSSAYGNISGELYLGEMKQINTSSWALGELGYKYDAPHVHADGQIDGGLHPPEYYAYSPPHTGSWEDGLQEIDGFDWPGVEEAEKFTSALDGESEGQGCEHLQGALSRAQSHVLPREGCLSLVDISTVDHDRRPSPEDAQSATTTPQPVIDTAPLEIACTESPRVPSPSPPRIPELSHAKLSTSAPVSLSLQSDLGPGSVDVENHHGVDPDRMDVDITPISAQNESAMEVPLNIREPVAQDNDGRSTSAQEEELVAAEAVAEGSNEPGDAMMTDPAPEASTWLSATILTPLPPTTSRWYGLMSSDNFQPIAASARPPTLHTPETEHSHATVVRLQRAAAFKDTLVPTHDLSVYSTPASTSAVVQNDQMEDLEAILEHPEDDMRPQDIVLPAPQLQSELETSVGEETAQVETEVAAPVASPAEEPTDLQLMELALTPVAENVHEPWEAQLRAQLQEATETAEATATDIATEATVEDAADADTDDSPDGIPEILSPGYRERAVGTKPANPTTAANEVSVQASSTSASTLLEQHLERNQESPPFIPLEPEIEAIGVQDDEIAGASTENVKAGAQAGHVVTQSLLEAQLLNIEVDDMRVDDQSSDAAAAMDVDEETATSPLDARHTIEALKHASTAPASKAKSANPRKHSRPAKQLKDASDTEEDTPAKKKPRTKATPVKPRASRAKKPSTAPQEQASDVKTRRPIPKRSAAKSAKEAETGLEMVSRPNGGTPRLAHFAYGKYSKRVSNATAPGLPGDIIFGTEAELDQPDNDFGVDMEEEEEERYSEVEMPTNRKRTVGMDIAAAPHTPPSSNNKRVSNSEMESLSGTRYRDRPARGAQQGVGVEDRRAMPGIHFALHLNQDTHVRPRAVEERSAVVVAPNHGNSFMLIEKGDEVERAGSVEAGGRDSQDDDGDDDGDVVESRELPNDDNDDVSDGDWSDAAIAAVKKEKGKAKGNPRLMAVQSKSGTFSRASTPAASVASSGSMPGSYKYGFTPARGPKTTGTGTVDTPARKSRAKAKATLKPKTAPKAKEKARKSGSDAVPADAEPPKEPDIRKTRRASALEDDIRKAASAKERQRALEVSKLTKAKLRSGGAEEGK
ncbi:hypothetical protein EJ02DRAFT_437698 [Clathrospora elynae]|uniref:Uncharacterized protein n=1 Tax=Clathrospora elynae TaxID=706981 RepID=A0A6A5SAN4_9PLEO|nr:hypothetical protein EJ02DRAFT_437698 [Clathrospora elynae]